MLASTAGFHLAERFDEVGFSDIVQIRNRVMELRAQGASVYQFEGGEPLQGFINELSAAVAAVERNQPSDLLGGQLARDALVLCHKECDSVHSGQPVTLT